MSDWHGWSRNGGPALHVGHLPGRKSAALYVIEKGVMDVLAYFRSDDEAARALAVLDRMFHPASEAKP